MTAINKQPGRHEIEELLPWYATGTLSGREAERVEQALAGDRELARRYELVRRELAETTRLNEALGAPSARAMEKLFAAINAEEPRVPRRPISRTRFLESPPDSAREEPSLTK
jgi:anti-sigma-K factor RskA